MEVKNSGTLFTDMLAELRKASGRAVSEGSEPALRLMALAAQLEALSYDAQWVYRQSFPQTADGQALDMHAELRGITRRSASHAEGVVRFFTDGGSQLSIPAGTVCLSGSLARYETLEDIAIAKGTVSGDAPARAVDAGEAGNIGPGSITAMALAPMGVSGCTNPVAFAGGGAAEADESLRERVVASYRSLPNGANAAYYETEAMAVSGVAAARAIPRPRGAGTVDICIASPGGAPSAALIVQVRATLEKKREIAVDLNVIVPRLAPVDIAAQLAVTDGYSFSDVSAAAQTALSTFFNGTLLARPVYVSSIVKLLLEIDGVKNVKLTSPSADIQAASDLLPVQGAVALAEMV